MTKICVSLIAFFVSAMLQPALAASFDCAAAKSVREQRVCQNPELSARDLKLSQVYRERLALLSPAGVELLKQSQRRWLRFIDLICTGPFADHVVLGRAYDERISELKTVAMQAGPFRFNRVDLYRAKRDRESETGSYPGFSFQHIAYPQIDNPASPAAIAWNRMNVRELPTESGCGEQCDDEEDFAIGYANQNFISISWSSFSYGHGAAHGFGADEASNWILESKPRAATAQDFFGADGSWAARIPQLFWDKLMASGWKSPEENAAGTKTEIVDDAGKVEKWFFIKEGVRLELSSYEGGCYACTPDPPTISWSALKPLLAKDAVLP